jgi:hypothetical protein
VLLLQTDPVRQAPVPSRQVLLSQRHPAVVQLLSTEYWQPIEREREISASARMQTFIVPRILSYFSNFSKGGFFWNLKTNY